MKKLALLLAISLGMAGLVATTGSATASPYPGTVTTRIARVVMPSALKRGQRLHITVKVAASGNATPVGNVVVTVKRVSGHPQRVIRTAITRTKGGTAVLHLGKIMRVAKYKVTIRFFAKSGTVFKDSSTTRSLRVVR